jgi:hypothetical protein
MRANRNVRAPKVEVILLVASALAGGLLAHFLMRYSMIDPVVVSKHTFKMGLLYPFLMGLLVYLRNDLNQLSGHEALSTTEHERLRVMITGKQRKILYYLIFYLFAAIYLIALSVVAEAVAAIAPASIGVAGAISAVTVVAFFYSWAATAEVNDFRWDLDKRLNSERHREKDLSKLCPK